MLSTFDNSTFEIETPFSRSGRELTTTVAEPLDFGENDRHAATVATAPQASQNLMEIKPDYDWLDFEATYYTKDEPGMDGRGITKTGTTVKAGRTIAVDPDIIPLGTRVYIEGIGYRVAEDTGGAIKGNRIDIYVDSVEEFPEAGRIKTRIRIVK